MRVGIAFIVVCVCAVAIVSGVHIANAYNSSKVDVSWYTGHEDELTYSIDTPGKLAGLAQLNNGTYRGSDGQQDTLAPVDFSGKTVRITDDILGLPTWISTEAAGAMEPIGTADHPFNGTVTGWNGSAESTRALRLDLTVSGSSSMSNIGIFGYVGASGCIKNLSVSSDSKITVSLSGTGASAQNIGSLAGTCMGMIANCSSAAKVTVTNNATLNDDAKNAIRNAGGLVGACKGDLTDSTFTGTLSVNSKSATYVDSSDSYPVAEHLGGVVGLYGDESSEDAVYEHGTIAGCMNDGTIDLSFSGDAKWSERFSEYIFPAAEAVGGVAGYSYGNIENCTNSGAIKAAKEITTSLNPGRKTYTGGDCVGGIVGSLRSVVASGSAEEKDAGKEGAELAITGCVNTGRIDGYHAVGGIAGTAGTYTTITRAHNSGAVYSYRWNKPAGAGIAGQAYGDVTYCYNTGDVESVPGAGYYCAGIVGMLFRYWKPGLVPDSPEPRVHSCYNAGHIYVNSGSGNWKQGGIVGQNDGYVHDNVLLRGTCYDNRFGSDPGSDYGTWGSNTLVNDSELKSNTALLALNALCDSDGWNTYFTLVSAESKNAGRPILNMEATSLGLNDLSTGTVAATLTANAPYTGLESVPTIAVTFDGATLTQNVDYKVIPETGATAYTGDTTPYEATIVGIGDYTGTAPGTVAYGITTGDLATCTVKVDTKKFNWQDQTPTKDMVHVYDVAGNAVDSVNWDFSTQGDSSGRYVNYKSGGYTVTVTPASGSNLYKGSVSGTYSITKVDIRSDCTTYGIEYMGQKFYWDDSKGDWVDGKRPQFTYTGSSIRPEIIGVSYNNKALLAGRDYKAIYGNPNSDTNADDAANANTAVTGVDGSNRGCVTARFVTYSSYGIYNFTNFTNMLFDIVPAGKLPSFIAYEQAYTGSAITPFAGSYMGLIEGTDYTVSYSGNTAVGTANYTVTGKGTYAGSTQTGTFKIMNSGDVPSRIVPDTIEATASPVAGKASANYGYAAGALQVQASIASSKTGVTATGYQWYESTSGSSMGTAISGATSATYSIPTGKGVGSYSYYCMVTTKDSSDDYETIASNAATVNVNQIASTASVTSASAITYGQSLASSTLSGTANPSDGTFAWEDTNIVPSVADSQKTAYAVTYTPNNPNYSMVKLSSTVKVNPLDVANTTVTFEGTSASFTGSATTPKIVVKVNGATLVAGTDYTIDFGGAELLNAGDYPFTVRFTGNYAGTTTGTFTVAAEGSQEMYRLYNPNSGEHFYTKDAAEKDNLASIGWNYEGIGWQAPETSNTPVYRLYNANGGEHHYTFDEDEKNMLVAVGWNYEGIGWYSDDDKRVPLFREYNPNAFANNHNYTTSIEEHEFLLSIGWNDEGHAWYGM